jgi:alpha-L-fucosidase
VAGGHFNEDKQRYTAEDIRFTTRGAMLYAIALGWPESGRLTIRSLTGSTAGSVHLLGSPDPLRFTREAGGLVVEMPASRPCQHAYALRIAGATA